MSLSPRKSCSRRVAAALAIIGCFVGVELLGADFIGATRATPMLFAGPSMQSLHRLSGETRRPASSLALEEIPQRLSTGLGVARHLGPLAVDAHFHRELARAGRGG